MAGPHIHHGSTADATLYTVAGCTLYRTAHGVHRAQSTPTTAGIRVHANGTQTQQPHSASLRPACCWRGGCTMQYALLAWSRCWLRVTHKVYIYVQPLNIPHSYAHAGCSQISRSWCTRQQKFITATTEKRWQDTCQYHADHTTCMHGMALCNCCLHPCMHGTHSGRTLT
jgi:hypothetical protein